MLRTEDNQEITRYNDWTCWTSELFVKWNRHLLLVRTKVYVCGNVYRNKTFQVYQRHLYTAVCKSRATLNLKKDFQTSEFLVNWPKFITRQGRSLPENPPWLSKQARATSPGRWMRADLRKCLYSLALTKHNDRWSRYIYSPLAQINSR